MTRINLIPARELSDQHLLAEIRELPRIFSHVEKHGVNKAKARGFNISYPEIIKSMSIVMSEVWKPHPFDVDISRARIQEKLDMKPDWYKWSVRNGL